MIFSYKTEDSRSFYLFINLLYNAWYKSFKNITFLFRYKRLFYGTHMSFFNMIAVSHFKNLKFYHAHNFSDVTDLLVGESFTRMIGLKLSKINNHHPHI